MSRLLNIADPRLTTVRFSNRQHAALKLFGQDLKKVIDLEHALEVDQRSFGSLHKQEYIYYDKGRGGFMLTPKGHQAMRIYHDTDVMNRTPAHRFSHFIRDAYKPLSNVFHFEATA